MRLSNMADYAVVVMSAAARHCGTVRVSATELSAETGIALPTTQKLVSLLSRHGLLRSTRGTGGGIQLARPAAAISLADIIEAIEGPISMTACVSEQGCECSLQTECSVKPQWQDVNAVVRGALAGISLAGMTRPASIQMKLDA